MSDTNKEIDPLTVWSGEARYDTDDHEHDWLEANNILGSPFAECLCGATARWVKKPTALKEPVCVLCGGKEGELFSLSNGGLTEYLHVECAIGQLLGEAK